MNNWSAKFALIVITLWVGALWTTGGMAYVLFDTLEDKQLAGQIAGKFFHYLSYLGMFAAGYLSPTSLFTSNVSTGSVLSVPAMDFNIGLLESAILSIVRLLLFADMHNL